MVMKRKDNTIHQVIRLVLLSAGLGLISLFSQWQKAEQVDTTNPITSPDHREAFIQSISEEAWQIGQANDLYASVMIAQAILESDSGQSELSQPPHYNYFGIKGHYQGQTVRFLSWDDDGSGNVSHVYADFKSYGDPRSAMLDYAAILTSPLYQQTRKSQTSSFRDATAALTGVYATDSHYQDKLNSLINR